LNHYEEIDMPIDKVRATELYIIATGLVGLAIVLSLYYMGTYPIS